MEPVYTTKRRGEFVRNLLAWGASIPGTFGGGKSFSPHDEQTTGADQLVSNNTNRSYFEIQNNSAADDMRINFGAPATANNGIVIIPGGSVRFEIQCPQDDIHLFCAVANNPFTWIEA